MRPQSILAGVRVGADQPVRLMAAINVSPESFYPSSVHADADALRDAAQRAVAEGADWIDIGARSTAPYRTADVSLEEEVRRMTWAVRLVAAAVAVPVSADTTRAAVVAAALSVGARIVNDVSGLHDDPAMADLAAQAEGVVLTATPAAAPPAAPVAMVRHALRASLARAAAAGIAPQSTVLDPGIGFFAPPGTSPTAFSLTVLRELRGLADFGVPLLVGVSRKRFIGEVTGRAAADERLAGSLAATAIAVLHGAAIIRTHDVAATRDAVRVAEALR